MSIIRLIHIKIDPSDIERYTNSAAHKQIVNHTRSVKGASAVVKLYDLVN
jgi:hypothetical protein